MKNIVMYSALTMALTACGGGGDSSDGGTDQTGQTGGGTLRAQDDRFQVVVGEQARLDVLANDQIPADSAIQISVTADPELTVDGNVIIYSAPDTGPFSKSFSYTLRDENGNSQTATVTIESVNSTAERLQAVDDEYRVNKNEQILLRVLENDNIPDGRTVTLSIPQNDQATVVGDAIQYTASDSDFFTSRFTYTIEDDLGNTSHATVNISAANDTRDARIDTARDEVVTTANTEIEIDVLANDSSSVDDDLTITEIVQAPRRGTATIVDNKIIYRPEENDSGYQFFTYGVRDESGNSIGGVSVWVLIEAKVDERYAELKLDSLNNFNLDHVGVMLQHDSPRALGIVAEGAGDVNGDGDNDVVACYTHQSVQVAEQMLARAGECFFVYGSADINQIAANGNALADVSNVLIKGGATDARLGGKVAAAGDVNDDGFDDVLFITQENDQLNANLLMGGTNFEANTIIPATGDSNRVISLQSNMKLLNAHPVGDVNNDDHADLVLIYEIEENQETSQQAVIVFGDNFDGNIDVDDMNSPEQAFRYISGRSTDILFNTESFEFGSTVIATGDVNDDGIDDFLLRVTNEFAAPEQQGAFIVFGRENYANHSQFLSSSNGIFITTTPTQLFGGVVLGDSGDFNNDGARDILVHMDDDLIVYSLDGLRTGVHSLDKAEQVITTISGAQSNIFGGVLLLHNAGDINGDDIDDIAIHNGGNTTTPFAFVYGSMNFDDQLTLDNLLLSNGGDGRKGAIIHDKDDVPGSVLGGLSSPLGDINDDGLADFVIGGIDEGADGEGEVNILFGGNHWGVGR